jgi:hypothetical protein
LVAPASRRLLGMGCEPSRAHASSFIGPLYKRVASRGCTAEAFSATLFSTPVAGYVETVSSFFSISDALASLTATRPW